MELDRLFGQQTDKAAVERLTATLDAKLAAYDTILSKSKYLAGDVSNAVLLLYSMSAF